MSDTLDTTAAPRRLLVDGRDPFADETITTDDGGALITISTPGDGTTLVAGVAGASGTVTITVSPGSEDTNRTAGSDTITVTTPVAQTPLVVTLEP